MKDYSSKRVKKGKLAFRTPSRFIYQKSLMNSAKRDGMKKKTQFSSPKISNLKARKK
ncbi:MAG: hypothetical protein Q7S82_03040 [bacterium]|nr:hypothetical protein [bacterium]